jgi:hypothetical protein
MVESICAFCLLTIGRVQAESDLDELEAYHNCRARSEAVNREKTGSDE